MSRFYDGVVIGAGPNGLAAAIKMAQHGLSVLVIEANSSVGGGARSMELTLPGFVHDPCSAIHPMGIASPFFRTLPLENYGLKWIHPPSPTAHPLDRQPSVVIEGGTSETARILGADGSRYQQLLNPLVDSADQLFEGILGPLRIPRHPLLLARFGWNALSSAQSLAERWFQEESTRALFAGMAAHSTLPLSQRPSAAIGLVLLTAAHARGWPIPQGGSQAISDALTGHFQSLGGEVVLNQRVNNIKDVPESRVVMLDVTPRQLLALAGSDLSNAYQRALEKFRYDPGIFKIDWALNDPIPWNDAACARAGTVHVGGTMAEIVEAENAAWNGTPVQRPFMLVAQQSLFDATRAPAGKHTGWAYCHVPHGSEFDMVERMELQMERFAKGFRDCILARHITTPKLLENYNANCIGGDISGGVQDLYQLFSRPVAKWRPYRSSNRKIYLCSSSTPPGGGVHGMCGYFAAKTALADHFPEHQ